MNLVSYWIALLVFSFSFILIVVRLVFNARFRKDLISNPATNSAKLGIFSITGTIIIMVIGILGMGIYLTADKILKNNVVNNADNRIPKAEQAIRDYFDYTNRLTNGEKKYNKKLWELFTTKYQEEKRAQFSHYNLPDELHILYTSSNYEMLNLNLLEKNKNETYLEYYVSHKRKEYYVENPFYNYFNPQTLRQIKDIDNLIENRVIINRTIETIKKMYSIPDNYNYEEMETAINNRYLNRFVSPGFISEIGVFLNLKLKPMEIGTAIGANFSKYTIFEGDKITVVKEDDGNYRIFSIKLISYGIL